MQPTAEQLKTTGGKAVEGAYYGGQRLMGGKLLAPGQDTEGHDISADVIKQSGANNVNFVNTQRAQAGMTASPTNAGNAVPSGMPGGGGGGAQPSAAPAIPDLAALYDNAYTKNPDVIAANAKIADIQSKITAREKALNDAVAGENDNPFYSEATRVGRVQKLNDNFNNDKNSLTGELGTAQTSIANLRSEAERQVNIAQGQYSLNNDAYKQNLDEFNILLSAGGLTNADPNTLSQISVSTGISLGMLSSIQQSQQAKNTQIVTSTDNAGNLNITAVNSQTGKILHSETLGGVGKSTGGGGGSTGSTGSTNKTVYQQFLDTTNAAQGKKINGTYVGTFPQLVAQFAPYMSLQDIYKNYSTTPLGKKYGTPQENAQDIKQIYSYYKGTPPKEQIGN